MIYSKIEGTGKPFLIIHGYLGMSDNWKTLGAQYAELGFEMHLLDMRNHGRSFHSDDFNYDVMVADVVAYCEQHQLKDIILLGHSMGGKIAMKLACSYPDLVAKLLIADISPRKYEPHHQVIFEALNAVDFSKVTSRKEVEDVIATYIPDFGTRQFLMKNVHRDTPESFAFRFNLAVFNQNDQAIGEALDVDGLFEKPTLFLKGAKSNYIQESDVKDIQKHFPQVVIEVIANAGHWLHAENPIAFFEQTKPFLLA